MFTALQAIDSLKILLSPFLPFSSELLHSYLGYEEPIFGTQEIVTIKEDSHDHEALTYNSAKSTGRWAPSDLKPGTSLKKPKPLFKKFDDAVIEEENNRLGQPRQ